MTKNDFLVALEDILQIDDPVEENCDLNAMEEWDSLSKMAIMAFYKKNFSIELALNSLSRIQTPADLITLAGENIR